METVADAAIRSSVGASAFYGFMVRGTANPGIVGFDEIAREGRGACLRRFRKTRGPREGRLRHCNAIMLDYPG